jgi:hypothetical protein
MRLPESIEVRVEESADTIYLVLPSTSPVGEGSDLSYQELDAVAGGFGAQQAESLAAPPSARASPAMNQEVAGRGLYATPASTPGRRGGCSLRPSSRPLRG